MKTGNINLNETRVVILWSTCGIADINLQKVVYLVSKIIIYMNLVKYNLWFDFEFIFLNNSKMFLEHPSTLLCYGNLSI